MIGVNNQIVFCTDCLTWVKMMHSPTEWSIFSEYLEEFQSDNNEFTNLSLSLIFR